LNKEAALQECNSTPIYLIGIRSKSSPPSGGFFYIPKGKRGKNSNKNLELFRFHVTEQVASLIHTI